MWRIKKNNSFSFARLARVTVSVCSFSSAMSSVSERTGDLFRARIECILQRDGKERKRERKGSSALKERGSEKHERRDPSAGKKSYKNRISFFLARIFFCEISFFGRRGGGKRKKKGRGVVMVVEREAKKPHQSNRQTRGGVVDA